MQWEGVRHPKYPRYSYRAFFILVVRLLFCEKFVCANMIEEMRREYTSLFTFVFGWINPLPTYHLKKIRIKTS